MFKVKARTSEPSMAAGSMVGPSMAAGSAVGSMTDASKRRISEHEVEPTIEEALEEFDVIQSIEAFNNKIALSFLEVFTPWIGWFLTFFRSLSCLADFAAINMRV